MEHTNISYKYAWYIVCSMMFMVRCILVEYINRISIEYTNEILIEYIIKISIEHTNETSIEFQWNISMKCQ